MAQRIIKRSGSTTHFTLVDGLIGFGTAAPDVSFHAVNPGGHADGSQHFLIEGDDNSSGIELRATGTGGRSWSVFAGAEIESGDLVFWDVTAKKYVASIGQERTFDLAVIEPVDGTPQNPSLIVDGRMRLFGRDNGFGRVDLCVQFPTGQVHVLHSQEFVEANFSATPLTGAAPLAVTFTDASNNNPTSWAWKKNNGSGWVDFAGTPTAQNPVETFAAGTWDIQLTATRADGEDISVKFDYITATTSAAGVPGGVSGLHRAFRASDIIAPDGALIAKAGGAYGTSGKYVGVGSGRPIFVTDQTPTNGPCARFDGVDDMLDFDDTSVLSAWHIFIVMAQTDLSVSNQAYLGGPTEDVKATLYSGSSTSDYIVANDSDNSGYITGMATKDTSWHIYEWKMSGTTFSRKLDGVADGTPFTMPGTQAYTFNSIGRWTSGGAPLQADIAEVLIYNAALSDVNAGLVRAVLKAAHGTP